MSPLITCYPFIICLPALIGIFGTTSIEAWIMIDIEIDIVQANLAYR